MNTIFENITILCSDQYPLSARFYPHQTITALSPVLISPATGIIQNFYHAFAEWLAKQGHPVMTFDFRGIGKSLHTQLKDSPARIQDWGQLDLNAAIDSLCFKTQCHQILLLGHSAGGQLLGISSNHHKVKNMVTVASSTGYIKNLTGRTKWLAPVMFRFIFPISRLLKGYGSTKFIGMGENLPKDVAKQWAEFCSRPGYVYNAIGKTIFEDFHQQVKTPMTLLWASDDEIATAANVNDLMRLYPNADTKMIEIQPAQYGHKMIGHMAMLRPSHQNLWPVILQYLQQNTTA